MNDQPGRKLSVNNVAITVLATLVIAIIAYGATTRAGHPVAVAPRDASPKPSTPARSSPHVEPSPTPPIGPPRPSIWGFDLAGSSSTGWLLLSNCSQPMAGQCQYLVAATADGGQTWSAPVQVGPSYDPGDGGAPRTVRFINALDGFVYGSGGAFATHDGGKSWSALDLHATFFSAMAGRGQTVWAATYPCPKGTLCPYDVRSSHDGGRSWSAPRQLPVGFFPSDLIPVGTSSALISGPSSGDLEMTSDGGNTWRAIKGQCSEGYFRAPVASSDGQEIWELCLGVPGDASAVKVLFVSEDGGKSWSQKASSQGQLPSLGTQVSLISTRPHKLLVSTDQTPLLLTGDAGASWSQVGTSPAGGTLRLAFANASDGWAMDAAQTAIWRTTDGGESWTRLPAYNPAP